AGNTYVYDAENRQTRYDGGVENGGATYVYSGEGQRIKKVTPSGTTIFVYNAARQLVSEYTSATAGDYGTSYLMADNLGTPRVIMNSSGNLSRHDYLPFGEEISASFGGRLGVTGYVPSDSLR